MTDESVIQRRRFGRTSFSQFGEDIAVRRLLRDCKNGFYVDVGAFHPFRFSNTAYFYDEGWRGINIEPDPEAYKLFEVFRPRDINLQIAVHDTMTEVELYRFEQSAVNTVLREGRQKRGYRDIASSIVPAMRLSDVLRQYVPEDTAVNYLDIDVEGYDLQAVKTWDFSLSRPNCISIECHKLDFRQPAEHPIVAYLLKTNYTLVAIHALTAIFFDKKV